MNANGREYNFRTTDAHRCTPLSVCICAHLWSVFSCCSIACGAVLNKIRVHSRPFAVSFLGDF
jgi:hypothetical protein